MTAYEILGTENIDNVDDLERGGAEDEGVVGSWMDMLSPGISAASEAAQRGVAYKQEQDASAKSKQDAIAAAARAIAADANWAAAEQQLELAAKDPAQLPAATALQQSAMSGAMQASASLVPDAQARRLGAAKDAADKAAHAALAAPSDGRAQALMHAWQKVVSAAVSGGGGGSTALATMPSSHGGEPSFFSRVHMGVPTWGWFLGGAGILGGGILLVRALRK